MQSPFFNSVSKGVSFGMGAGNGVPCKSLAFFKQTQFAPLTPLAFNFFFLIINKRLKVYLTLGLFLRFQYSFNPNK